MKKWEEDLVQYKLFPAPPRRPLNEYIRLYLDEKDEKYLEWFLHYFEPQLNTKSWHWYRTMRCRDILLI